MSALLIYDETQNTITCTNSSSSSKSTNSKTNNNVLSSQIAIGRTILNVGVLDGDDIRSVKIYDLVGRELYSNNRVIKNNVRIYDYELMTNKVYIVQISTDSKKIIKKIIKK